MFTSNRISLSTLLFCIAGTTACHEDIGVITTSSATDDNDIFGTSTGSHDTEMVPTTSAGDSTGNEVDPTQFCKLHPSDDYAGFVFVCSGETHGGLRFDYYGDLAVDTVLPCFDLTSEPYNQEKPEGYTYTCFAETFYQFGPEIPSPNGHNIDACCLRDSPFEAAADYCRADAAEEFCSGAVDTLNEMRAKLPVWPSFYETNQQLENLNKFIADAETQTTCSLEFAQGFVQMEGSPVSWKVEHPQALDPELGWPLFRDITTYVTKLEIEDAENNGLACSDIGEDAVTGVVGEGTLLLESHLGAAKTATDGIASYKRSDCRLASCEFQLEEFSLEVGDFTIDKWSFSDVSISLAAPTSGLINRDAIALPENRMHMTATFRVAEQGRPMFDGAPVSVGLHNHSAAHLRLLPDSTVAVEKLEVTRWPFEMKLGL